MKYRWQPSESVLKAVGLAFFLITNTVSAAVGQLLCSEDFSSADGLAGWSKIQDESVVPLKWDLSGCMVVDTQDERAGDGAVGCSLPTVLTAGQTVEISAALINREDSSYKACLQLWNLRDDVLVAESEELMIPAANSSLSAPLMARLIHTASEDETEVPLQIRLKNPGKRKQAGMFVDKISIHVFDSLSQPAYPRKNLVENPGFDALFRERSGGMIPTCWEALSGPIGHIQVSASAQKEGIQALLLEGSGDGPVEIGSDFVPVFAGVNYSAGADVRSLETPAVGVLQLRFYDQSDRLIAAESAEGSAASWTSLTITAAAPADAVKARVVCAVPAGSVAGTVGFDNAYLVYADEMISAGGWSVASGGTSLVVPAAPMVPYRLSADARRLESDAGGAVIQMRFLDQSRTPVAQSEVQVSAADWAPLELSAVAPAATAYVQVLLNSPDGVAADSRFKNMSLRENYELYYVSPNGRGDGRSYAAPADYTSPALWTKVNTAAEDRPVKVVFRSGSYSDSHLMLRTIGTLKNTIVLEGEKPFGSVFDGIYGVRFYGTRNLVLRNIHFISPAQSACFAMMESKGVAARHITVSDCYLINITNITYGACSMSGRNVYDITVSDCDFIRVGKKNDGSHMIYNSHDSHRINIENNYFEDGWGTYVKIRSGSRSYRIVGNTFVQNNGYRTTSSKPFIHFSAINSQGDRDEVVGTDYRIEGNVFEYNRHANSPIWILITGATPSGHPGYYEVSRSEKSAIEGRGSPASRNAAIQESFGIDIQNDWVIAGNTYLNTEPIKLLLHRSSPPRGFSGVSADLTALIED